MFSNSISLYLLFSNRFMTGEYFRNIIWAAVVSNPFVPNAALRFSNVFRGVEKGCIGNKWVNMFLSEVFLLTFYPTLPCSGLREHDISYALLRLLVHASTTKKRELQKSCTISSTLNDPSLFTKYSNLLPFRGM